MKRLFVTLSFILLIVAFCNAQLANQDLRSVHSEAISDSELMSFYDKAKAQNLSDEQIAELLLSKGMPQAEILKLQNRIKAFTGKSAVTGISSNNNNKIDDNSGTINKNEFVQITLDSVERQIYGMELFTTPSLSFEPNLRVAPSPDYILGPDDQLLVNVYGYSEAQYKLTVSPEGNITIPNVGPIYISGLSLDAAKSKITAKLASTIYRAISAGRTFVNITLASPRSIKVVVIGQARKPGTYTVSSFSTLFNILYLCGGPNKSGSFRKIQIIRGGTHIKTSDLYGFLHDGDISSNIPLQNNDVIRIPYYETRVRLMGEFKRSGYFELTEKENLSKLLTYAGGFSDSAYRAQLRVFQIGGKERNITVLSQDQYGLYHPATGDEIVAEKVSVRFANRVTILGAVNRPGHYDLEHNMSLKQLLLRADGTKEDAFTLRASISRLEEDMTRRLITFDVTQILSGKSMDIPLKREDIITIPSLLDLKDSLTLRVEGQVRQEGIIPFKTGMTVSDAIIAAGGFTEAASGKRLEIGRRILNAEDGKDNLQVAEVIVVDTEKDLSLNSSGVQLQPNDIVIVRNNPGYYKQKSVYVNGEVKFSGKYILAEKDERLSDLIVRAGGLSSLADASAASLERINKNFVSDTTYKVGTLSKLGFDSSKTDETFRKIEKIGINLEEVINYPHSSTDIILEDGDVITIPKRDGVVKVRGEVLVPTQLSYIKGETLKFYIGRAGGFTQKAVKRKTFVISANGNAKRTKSFLFFKNYPVVNAGDEIYVPQAVAKSGKGLSTGEILGLTTALATLSSILLSIFK